MYRLLAHLADPSGCPADILDREVEVRSAIASHTPEHAPGFHASDAAHGRFHRAPPPRLHDSR